MLVTTPQLKPAFRLKENIVTQVDHVTMRYLIRRSVRHSEAQWRGGKHAVKNSVENYGADIGHGRYLCLD